MLPNSPRCNRIGGCEFAHVQVLAAEVVEEQIKGASEWTTRRIKVQGGLDGEMME